VRRALWVLFIVVSAVHVAAQDNKPRVAIIPFNHISVSKADSEALTNLFETALVTTEVFQVIEQTQISDILSAQEFSAADCTDEACAVEFGKLLSAEQIVLGTVSSVGGKYILTAKIIDVKTGRNLKADKAQANSLGDLTDAVEPLAFKMAGLTVQRGTETVVAREFGEIFVETTPTEADILINGVPKGKSPNLFTRVPVGKVLVESRKGNLYASAEVDVTTSMRKVTLALSVVQGNLFISSSDKQVQVYLDGQSLGALGAGLFEKIPVGQHVLELKSGSSYSRDEIVVKEGESTKVEAHPRAYGTLQYTLPEGVSAEVVSPTYREVIRGAGTLSPLWADSYTVTTSGEDFERVEAKVQIERGGTASFAPALEYSEAYRAKASAAAQEREKLQAERLELEKQELARKEAQRSEAEQVEIRTKEIEGLKTERSEVQKRIRTLESRARLGRWPKWVALGTGAAAAGASAVSFVLGTRAYRSYLDAGSADWELWKTTFRRFDLLGWIGAGAGGAAVSLGVTLWVTEPKDANMTQAAAEARIRIAEIDARIGTLEGGAK
jgi:TolB-like protein